MKKIISLIATAALSFVLSSCKDSFLDQPPIGSVSDQTITTPAGLRQALIGAYAPLNGAFMITSPGQMAFGSIRGGEAHKGSSANDFLPLLEIALYSVKTNNNSGHLFGYYNNIFRCNLVLKSIPLVVGMTDAEKTHIGAQARFLRGHYYFHVKRLHRYIPWVDETLEDVRVPNVDASGNYVDIWPKILADFKYAMDNLPATQTDLGRPNKWAAKSYYAKTLLYMGNEGDNSNYALAKTQFDDIISNGINNKGAKYMLNANYHDNFNTLTENGPESVWAVQHSVNDGSNNQDANANQDTQFTGSFLTPASDGPGNGGAIGFFVPSQWFVNFFRVGTDGLPILDDNIRNLPSNRVKSDDGLESTTPYTPDAGLLDPRLDWAVGRRGIPYLDYGLMPGKRWIRDQPATGPYISKKWMNLKSRNNIDTAPNRSWNAVNVDVIRFADVLLLAAEVEARLGNLFQARTYVNQVRNRMATNTTNPENWVMNGNVPAANYKISLYPINGAPFDNATNALKAILFERSLELGLEGHRAYDLVRYGAEDGVTDIAGFNDYVAYESKLKGYLIGIYTRVPDAYMPIPQTTIDNSFKDGATTLKQIPGY